MKKTFFVKRFDYGISDLVDYAVVRNQIRKSSKYAPLNEDRMAIFSHDLIGIHVNQFGLFERQLLETLFIFLAPMDAAFKNGTALDIGANIGNHTRFFSKIFRNVVAFEPNPEAFHLLSFNVSRRGNVRLFPFALGASEFRTKIELNTQNMGASSIETSELSDNVSMEIEVKTLDSILPDSEDISFIKIDVEGYEAQVVLGGHSLIEKNRPVIAFEYTRQDGGSEDVVSFIRNMKYQFFWFETIGHDGPCLLRQFNKIVEIMRGRRWRVVGGDNIPAGSHEMIIAIPDHLLHLFSVNDPE